MSRIDFTGRTVIVTGAAGGLGSAYAAEIARRGGSLVLVDVAAMGNSKSLDALAASVTGHGGEAIACGEDVASAAAGERIAAAALDRFGRIDAVINSAGNLHAGALGTLDDAERDAVWSVHLAGAVNVTRPAFRAMVAQGHGRIVNTTSAAGLWGLPERTAYAGAKAGLVGMTRAWAKEGAAHGILCNAIAPVAFTAMIGNVSPEHAARIREMAAPFGEALKPEYVAPLAVFLASDACTVNGETYSALGGRYARVVTALTQGWLGPRDAPASPEDILAHLDEIGDLSDLIVPNAPADEYRLIAERIAREGSQPSGPHPRANGNVDKGGTA
jgi:NAD(P)-dependent dehydrogenase (short-subunit alcohol dehydrogenase family)